jgi:hypothetical protein
MAITVTVEVSNTVVSANEPISVRLKVVNGGGSTVNVCGIQASILPEPSRIGQPSVGIQDTVAIAAAGTRYFPIGAVAFAPQQPGSEDETYTISALVALTDGTVTASDSVTVRVAAPDTAMPVDGQTRFDSNIDSSLIPLLFF